MPIQLNNLVLRATNGAPLTTAQGDANLKAIQAAFNALAQIMATSLNPDGTLAAGSLNAPSQLANLPALADTLSANESLQIGTFAAGNYQVNNANVTAYAAGTRVSFLALSTNTGATTVQFNGLAKVNIFKGVNSPLLAGDIPAASIVELIHDGINFQMMATLGTKAQPVDVTTGTDALKAVTAAALSGARFISNLFPLAAGNAVTQAHGLVSGVVGAPAAPFNVRWVLVCQVTDGAGFAPGDEVPIGHFFCGVSNSLTDTYSSAFVGGANANNVFLNVSTLGGVSVANKGNGINSVITLASWKARCYASMI